MKEAVLIVLMISLILSCFIVLFAILTRRSARTKKISLYFLGGNFAIISVLGIAGLLFSEVPHSTVPNKEKQKPVEQAAVEQAAVDAGEHRRAFVTVIESINADGLILNVREGFSPDEIHITVDDDWHYEPYQMRLQAAQGLWEAWARIHSPREPDRARISLRDRRGNEVGGSRVWAGSLVWVQK